MFEFSYDYSYDDGDAHVSRTFSAEAPLSQILSEFRYFLQSTGFNYVEELSATCINGIEHTSRADFLVGD